MKVLLIGANGFIGRHIEAVLHSAGHEVLRGVTKATGANDVAVDLGRDTRVDDWLPRLHGVHAVVNAVGILRSTAQRPIQAVHADAPLALFQACAHSKVQRVLHLSALGIDGNSSPYAVTKLQAERGLQELCARAELNAVVLRPSVVFGAGGDSSELFMALSRLPVLVLPGPAVHTRVQPVHALELAAAVERLLQQPDVTGTLACVGPQAVALAGLIASLRQQQGRSTAPLWPLPTWLTLLSAKAADLVPVTPWGSDALSLLSADNVADPSAFAAVLGRAATHYDHFLTADGKHLNDSH